MSFFKKLASLFTLPASGSPGDFYTFTIQCLRCGEHIQGRVDFRNQLSAEYDDSGRATHFFCRKVLIGQGHCFQQIEAELTFDLDHKVTDRKITGGKFVEDAGSA
jgi:hypothetical protein